MSLAGDHQAGGRVCRAARGDYPEEEPTTNYPLCGFDGRREPWMDEP